MRKLSREYGWSAAGVYLALTALDFPLCFLGVRMLGTERVAYWEHVAIDAVKTVLKYPMEKMGWSEEDLMGMGRKVLAMVGQDQDGVKEFAKPGEVGQPAGQTWGVEEAETAANKHDASTFAIYWMNFTVIPANTTIRSYLDTIGPSLRDSQIVYLCQGPAYSRSDAKGSQGPKRLGMEYWEAKTETIDGKVSKWND